MHLKLVCIQYLLAPMNSVSCTQLHKVKGPVLRWHHGTHDNDKVSLFTKVVNGTLITN